jgi:putative Mn2+ efflux pump MntP
MDAFAVSVCKGLSMRKATLKASAICGGWFGGFQALMPLIGYFLGSLFADAIQTFDHWVAFGLLALIGVNMLREAFGKDDEEDCGCTQADLSFKTMFVMAIATSIDALAGGISLAMDDMSMIRAMVTIGLIGIVTFAMSAAGVKIGNVFGSRFEKKAEAAGGFILIGLGIKIIIDHHFWEIFL